MENNLIRTIIDKIFEPHLYEIRYTHEYAEYCIYEKENKQFCFCINFYEQKNKIQISVMSKCGKNTGSFLLNKIEELAKSIENIHYITLEDLSKIKIYDSDINLAILKILTKGESWYNSLGFFSDGYTEEKNHNEYIRNTPINNIFDFFKVPGELATKYFPEIDIKLLTKDYFNKIVPLINNNEQSKFVKDLIDKISPIIKYDRFLKKTIRYNNTNFENKNGGKKLKKRTRKIKIKKSNIKKRNQKTKGKNKT